MLKDLKFVLAIGGQLTGDPPNTDDGVAVITNRAGKTATVSGTETISERSKGDILPCPSSLPPARRTTC